jgi:hypothetical protein
MAPKLTAPHRDLTMAIASAMLAAGALREAGYRYLYEEVWQSVNKMMAVQEDLETIARTEGAEL